MNMKEMEEKLEKARTRLTEIRREIAELKGMLTTATKDSDHLKSIIDSYDNLTDENFGLLDAYGVNDLYINGDLSGWEYSFCSNLLNWRGDLTDKQLKRLQELNNRISEKLGLTGNWKFYDFLTLDTI